MYVSTPQHIIDEESAPGPVAQWMESSENDMHSSTDSESDSSHGSHTTASRIRRVIAGRRRRKSSAASKDMADAEATRTPSLGTGSVSPNHADAVIEESESGGPDWGHRLGAIELAEDGDDEEREKGSHSRRNSVVGARSKRARKRDRKRRDREKRERRKAQRSGDSAITEGIVRNTTAERRPMDGANRPRIIDFAVAEDAEAAATDPSQRRAFTLRNFSSTIRPQLPKTFSQNVFTQPSPVPSTASGRPIPRVKYGIRRTNSLPDRLNQTSSVPATGAPTTSPQPSSIPATAVEEKPAEADDPENISRTTAVLLLLISTGLVAVCAEFMVDSINAVVSGNSGLNEAFIGLIILPIVGNAAEHVTAVTVASKNKMDLAIGVAVGSSIQIGMFSPELPPVSY
jgi:Ca2+:H+ antiporter